MKSCEFYASLSTGSCSSEALSVGLQEVHRRERYVTWWLVVAVSVFLAQSRAGFPGSPALSSQQFTSKLCH